jgi:hypothetical protein
METKPQGNFLCSYLYLKLAKTLCFSLYLLCFFFYKIREQQEETGSAQEGGVSTSGRREEAGKGVEGDYGTNNDTHVCKCKNDKC